MTENEAKEYMENEVECIKRASHCDRDCLNCELVKEETPLIESYGMAIQTLEEIQQYRAIGTVEDFKALKEKNEPKKIRKTYGTWSGDNYFKFPNNAVVYQCIECYSTVRVGENYCCNCGSCIDWSK